MTKPTHILLAEDDADDTELFLEAISTVDPSITVSTVDNGEKLMDHLKGLITFPDCIFLDLNMPKKNGKECLVELKNNEITRKIPVIIYSTSHNAKDIDETFNRGASCFIRKPNTFTELTDLLNKCLASALKASNPHTVKNNFVLNSR